MDETSNGHTSLDLTPGLESRERRLLAELLDPNLDLLEIVPKNLDPAEMLDQLAVCCKAGRGIERAQTRLTRIVGMMLLRVQALPEVYERAGVRTFDEFIGEYVAKRWGYRRSSAYNAMRLCRAWPTLPQEEWDQLGTVKLSDATKIVRQDSGNAVQVLRHAKQLTVDGFRKYLADQGLVERGELQKEAIIVAASHVVAARWRRFKADPRVASYVGSEDEGVILDALMSEASGEWLQERE